MALDINIQTLKDEKAKETESGFRITYSKGTSNFYLSWSDLDKGRFYMWGSSFFVFLEEEDVTYEIKGRGGINFEVVREPYPIDSRRVLLTRENLHEWSRIREEDITVPICRQIIEWCQHWKNNEEYGYDYTGFYMPILNK